MKNLKIVSIILLITVFISPYLGALLSMIGQGTENNQFAGYMWLLMGIYNLPFFIASLVTFLSGVIFSKKQKNNTSNTLFIVSIAASIIGTILMLSWGVGTIL